MFVKYKENSIMDSYDGYDMYQPRPSFQNNEKKREMWKTYGLIVLSLSCVALIAYMMGQSSEEHEQQNYALGADATIDPNGPGGKDSRDNAMNDISGNTDPATGQDTMDTADYSGPQNKFLSDFKNDNSIPDQSTTTATTAPSAASSAGTQDYSASSPSQLDSDSSAAAQSLADAYGNAYPGTPSTQTTGIIDDSIYAGDGYLDDSAYAAQTPMLPSTPGAPTTASSLAPSNAPMTAPDPTATTAASAQGGGWWSKQGQAPPPNKEAVDYCKATKCGKIKNPVSKHLCEQRCAVQPRFSQGAGPQVTSHDNKVDLLRPLIKRPAYVDPDAGQYGAF